MISLVIFDMATLILHLILAFAVGLAGTIICGLLILLIGKLMTDKIGGIPADAPLWNNTPLYTLTGIVDLLTKASYHYADDSGQEWGEARAAKEKAARAINEMGLKTDAIKALHDHAPQLITYDDLLNAVLKDLRK